MVEIWNYAVSHYKWIWPAAQDVPLDVHQGLHPNFVLKPIKQKKSTWEPPRSAEMSVLSMPKDFPA